MVGGGAIDAPSERLSPYGMAVIYDGSAKALPYGGIYGRAMPRPMGEVSAHECADDGEGIFSPYATAVTFQTRFARGFFVLSFAARKTSFASEGGTKESANYTAVAKTSRRTAKVS